MFKISVKIGVTAVFALALFALSISHAYAVTFKVNCDKGNQTINKALPDAVDGDTIKVSGTCRETVIISKNRIKLIGSPGASIIGPLDSGDMIRVRGLNVVISGFSTLTGDGRSIRVERSGSAIIKDNTILDSGSTGISVKESSSALIENNTVENSVVHGIRVTESSYARIRGNNVITKSGRHGIIVSLSAAADIDDNIIRESQLNGVNMNRGGSGDIDGNTITDNMADGIVVRGSSAARLAFSFAVANSNTLERNGGVGVRCVGFSALVVDGAQNFGTGGDANVAGDTSIGEDCAVGGDAIETVPNVVGLSEVDAVEEITIEAGLVVGVITNSGSGGIVISQDPAAGTITVDGSFFPVDFVMSP